MTSYKYIVAVSGGVDSVVLLDMLASKKPNNVSYVVAHLDHGIREDSAHDYEFVESLAKRYGYVFEGRHLSLGRNASEAQARDARYEFLRETMKKHNADKIITAHHQDDLLETMIINIIRGTSPRGLAPMQGQYDILRPLINKRKVELTNYAKENNLKWREDSTNADEKYLRNYIRQNVMPFIESSRDKLLEINKNLDKLYHDIDLRVSNLLYGQRVLNRTRYLYLPYKVQLELTRSWLHEKGIKNLDRKTIERITIAIKTMPVGKKTDIDGSHWLISEKQNIIISSK